MKKPAKLRKRTPSRTALNSNHSLVGTWEQEPNPEDTTPVVYTIVVKQGKFHIAGKDKEDGTVLKISKINWDGSALCFTSLYPPTKHRAEHELKILPSGKMLHAVWGVYDDGFEFSENQIWIKMQNQRG